MLDVIIKGFFVVGVIYALFIGPVYLAKGIDRLSQREDGSKKDKILVYIPFINTCRAEAVYTGRVSSIAIALGAFAVIIPAWLITVYKFPTASTANLIMLCVAACATGVLYATNVIFVFRVLHDGGTLILPFQLLAAAIFPIGHYYIGTCLPVLVERYYKEDGTF